MTPRSNNFHVIDLIDKIGDERIFRVECVCGSIGKITESGLKTRISCGCTKFIHPHRLGLKVHTYKFVRFVGEKKKLHIYEIECDSCSRKSEVTNEYIEHICPKCPRLVHGVMIDIYGLSEKIGITQAAFYDRLRRMSLEEAIAMPAQKTGGCNGIHGLAYANGVLDTLPNHLRNNNALHRKSYLYLRIRGGMDPSAAIQLVLDQEKNREEMEQWGKKLSLAAH